MNPRFGALGLALVWAVFGAPSGRASADGGNFQAGAAKAVFDLPRGTPLAGYSKRKGKPSQGTADPVGARAVAVSDGRRSFVLVSGDLLIIDEEVAAGVNARARAMGVPADVPLLIAATHTHSGPGAYGRRFAEKISMGHFDPDVRAAVEQALAEVAFRAHQGLRPARLAVGSGTLAGLSRNRVEEQGIIDADVAVAALYPVEELSRRNGVAIAGMETLSYLSTREPIAVVVNFAAHPTTFGASNMRFSADYPGVAAREIERRWPSAVALFLAGAAGDQAPVKEGDGPARAERIGLPLAEKALQLLQDARPETETPVDFSRWTVILDAADVRFGGLRLFRWLSRRVADDDATLSVARAGKWVIAAAPCDLAAGLGRDVKAAAREAGYTPMIAGFADDYIGYCVTPEEYARGSYEASMAFNGPRTGRQITDALVRLVREQADGKR